MLKICRKCLHSNEYGEDEIDECCGIEMTDEDKITPEKQSPYKILSAIENHELPRFKRGKVFSGGFMKGVELECETNLTEEAVTNILIATFKKRGFTYDKDFICWRIIQNKYHTSIIIYPSPKDKSFEWFKVKKKKKGNK